MPLCMWSLRRGGPPVLVGGAPPEGCCAKRTDAPVTAEIAVAHLLKHLRVLIFIGFSISCSCQDPCATSTFRACFPASDGGMSDAWNHVYHMRDPQRASSRRISICSGAADVRKRWALVEKFRKALADVNARMIQSIHGPAS